MLKNEANIRKLQRRKAAAQDIMGYILHFDYYLLMPIRFQVPGTVLANIRNTDNVVKTTMQRVTIHMYFSKGKS